MYESLAKATGGEVYNIDSSEMGIISEVFDFIGATAMNSEGIEEGEAYLIRTEYNVNDRDKLVFPVDSTLTKLAFTIKSNAPVNISIKNASGNMFGNKADKSKIVSFSTGCIILVESPDSGSWSITTSSKSNAMVELIVKGRSPIRFYNFEYQKTVLGREGFMTIRDKDVQAGSHKRFRTRILGKTQYKDIEYFELKNRAFETIKVIKGIEDYIPGEKLTRNKISVPYQDTIIYAYGRDIDDNEFIRMYPITIDRKEH